MRAAGCRGRTPLDYLPLARLLWAPAGKTVGEVIACKGTLYERLVEPLFVGGAEYRCAFGGRAARRRNRPRNACRWRPGLPSADCARGIGRDADRAGTGFVAAAWRLRCSLEHQLRAIRFSAERVEALDFGDETITLNADDAVVLAVPPYAAASMVTGLQSANRLPRHRQCAFSDRAARGTAADPRSAQRDGAVDFFVSWPAYRSPSAQVTDLSTRRGKNWREKSGMRLRA